MTRGFWTIEGIVCRSVDFQWTRERFFSGIFVVLKNSWLKTTKVASISNFAAFKCFPIKFPVKISQNLHLSMANPLQNSVIDDSGIPRLPVNTESIKYNDWNIQYTKSHILKSICTNENKCKLEEPNCCELCFYNFSLELPSLPDMVFPRNALVLTHTGGAVLQFNAMDALKRVSSGRLDLKVAFADEWKETRPAECTEVKTKPFDWTFSTDYQGSANEKLRSEPTELKIDVTKLMKREAIMFYQDITLFEDELHDNGIAVSSVKIRVMPSGFFILLRYFLRVDNVMVKIVDTRFHLEAGLKYILKEFTFREAKVDELAHLPPSLLINPSDLEKHVPVKQQTREKLTFCE
ncbi:TIP41-like protein [Phlebotomus argentipes]|uniref:TIP41-like protein n=1 Tax=Phlebotomus argentipes TaxID=94469 RepID=UPI002893435B|nr:TIP41-like protein [Phlebotomus argentipes]